MDATSNLNLPFIMAAQAQKHVTHNEALRALDALVQLMVLDKDLSAPPGSPAEGARYIVGSSPTGAWSGQAGRIAAYQDAAWAFHPPREGWAAWVADEDKLYVWSGTAWAELAGGGGIGSLVEDATPQLGGDLDANGHGIGFGSGTGITDDAGNEQLVFHKTASAVNQVGITNAATGGAPQIAAEGGDANIDLVLAGKGSGHPKAAVFGVNASADATTRLAVSAAASLFNHAGSGHQHKINKNAAGDTASLRLPDQLLGPRRDGDDRRRRFPFQGECGRLQLEGSHPHRQEHGHGAPSQHRRNHRAGACGGQPRQHHRRANRHDACRRPVCSSRGHPALHRGVRADRRGVIDAGRGPDGCGVYRLALHLP